jgi:hypothetical protein
MITESQLAIVDLTHARPSVYYEAGFAEAQFKPIVYTVRSDHFLRGAPDHERVHFDLDKKPILKWHEVNSQTFRDSLRGRLRYYIRPLLRDHAHKEAVNKDKAEFARLSPSEKGHAFYNAFGSALQTSGYLPFRSNQEYQRFRKGRLEVCHLHYMIRFTKTQFRDLVDPNVTMHPLGHNTMKDKITEYHEQHLFCSHGRLPVAVIDSLIPYAQRTEGPWQLTWNGFAPNNERFIKYYGYHPQIPRSVFVRLVEQINSITKLAIETKNFRSSINPYKTTLDFRKGDKYIETIKRGPQDTDSASY